MNNIPSKVLTINNSSKVTLNTLLATVLSALVSYYFMIVDGYTCLDGMCM